MKKNNNTKIEKEKIKAELENLHISSYLINDDLTVDVYGSVMLINRLFKELPFKFNRITKDFNVHHCNIRSFKNFPNIVKGSLIVVDNNKLTSMDGFPKEIGGNIAINDNRIEKLESMPEIVIGNFDCSGNLLTSLEGSPQKIKGKFICFNNPLASLFGMPEYIKEDVIIPKEINININNMQEHFKFVGGDINFGYDRYSYETGIRQEDIRKTREYNRLKIEINKDIVESNMTNKKIKKI